MTSKDAVKYRDNPPADCWYIPVKAVFPAAAEAALMEQISRALKPDAYPGRANP
jgi:tetraacyldisaccharide-1-P 4'-kinase